MPGPRGKVDWNPLGPVEMLTREQTAERELVAAIRILVDGGERLAVLILAEAARELCIADTGRDPEANLVEVDIAADDDPKDTRTKLKLTYNFLRHGGYSTEGAFAYPVGIEPLHVGLALAQFAQTYGRVPDAAYEFSDWMKVHSPDFAPDFRDLAL